MKLLNRILSGWFSFGHYTLDVPQLHLMRGSAREAFCVNVQNVFDWFDDLYPLGEALPELHEICPLWKLPFPVMWFEFEGEGKQQFGALVYGADDEDDEEDEITVNAFMYDMQGDTKNAKFIASTSGTRGSDMALNDIKLRIGPQEQIDEAGANKLNNDLYENREFRNLVNGVFYPVAASIAFFHCKNVQIKHCAEPRQSRKAKRRMGVPTPSFHTIEVHKRTVHTLASGDPQSSRAPMPASFVRGHFKNYTGDSKLFGKKNGIWFWSMHVRGEGAPVKSDYRTWPPEYPHTKNCLVQIEN